MSEPIQLLLVGLAGISLYMIVVWLFSLLIRNAGIVDVAWSLGFSFLAVLYACLKRPEAPTAVLLMFMYVFSSLRLTWHLGRRFIRSHPQEDPRYAELRHKMGESADGKMLLVFLFQGAVLAVFTIPMVLGLADGRSEFDVWMVAAVFLWMTSLVGETIADHQLVEFLREPKNRDRTCQVGLWRYSRHPNYFFEWLCSISFALYVSGSQWGCFAWVSPALLLHLLFNVSGIKPSEEHSLKTRADYGDYVKRTSAFFPWPRRTPR